MLVHIKKIVGPAVKGKYAIGAFNTANLETTLGIARAAAATNRAVIIQVSEKTIAYAGLSNIFNIIKSVAESDGKKVPIAIHLDHGKNWSIVKACIDMGFSSIHLDGSVYPLAKNIALTKKAVDYGHRRGVWVQGELGALLGKEGLTGIDKIRKREQSMTDPSQVKKFVRSTGVDTLAVSIGTMHGAFPGQEKIDFALLRAIFAQAGVPLVLHGASGVKEGEIRRAISGGIRIINLDTDLRLAFTTALRVTLRTKDRGFFDPRQVLQPSIEAIRQTVERKIKLFSVRS